MTVKTDKKSNDLISRSAVVKELERLAVCGSDRNRLAYAKCISAVELAPAVPMWIPVAERLPEESGNYIVTACDENCAAGEGIWYSTVVVVAEYYRGGWSWYEGGHEWDLSGLVTHWMPLPEPPKEDWL